MSTALLIARRELGAYLRSMTGYIIAAIVLLVDGLLFNVFAMGTGEKLSAEVVSQFFYAASGITMIASVFISMRLLAEERQTGTLVLLYLVAGARLGDRPRQVPLGLRLPGPHHPGDGLHAALVLVNGKVSFGHLAAGYLGLLLLGSAALAIGTFGSALARTQVLAAIFSGCIVVGAGHLLAAGQGDRAAASPTSSWRWRFTAGTSRRSRPGPSSPRRRLLPGAHLRRAVRRDPGPGGTTMALKERDSAPTRRGASASRAGLSSGASACWRSSSASGSSARVASGPPPPRSACCSCVAAIVVRFVRARAAAPDRRVVERTLGALYGLGLGAILLYVVQSDLWTSAFGAPLEKGSPKLATALAALWPALWIAAAFPVLFVELAYAQIARAPRLELGRIRAAMMSGLRPRGRAGVRVLASPTSPPSATARSTSPTSAPRARAR